MAITDTCIKLVAFNCPKAKFWRTQIAKPNGHQLHPSATTCRMLGTRMVARSVTARLPMKTFACERNLLEIKLESSTRTLPVMPTVLMAMPI